MQALASEEPAGAFTTQQKKGRKVKGRGGRGAFAPRAASHAPQAPRRALCGGHRTHETKAATPPAIPFSRESVRSVQRDISWEWA